MVTRLRAEGPLTANELGGAKKGGTWWDWSETKIAAEWLLDIGQLVCRRRRASSASTTWPSVPFQPSCWTRSGRTGECTAYLVAAAARTLGVATVADLAAYHGMLQAEVAARSGAPPSSPRSGWRDGRRLPTPTRQRWSA